MQKIPFVGILLVVAVVLAACGGATAPVEEGVPADESGAADGPPAPLPDAPLLIWGEQDLTNTADPPSVLMNEQIAAFEEETGIAVQYEQVAWDQLVPKLALAVTSGGAVPDLMETSSQHIPALLDAGALMPLDDLLTDYAWLAELNEAEEQACIYDGQRYCVSSLLRSSITYYRTAAFPDGFPTTSEAFRAMASELKADDRYIATFFSNKEYAMVEVTWGQWFYSNGGNIFDAEGRPAWVSPEVIEVLEFGREMFANDYFPTLTLTGDFAAAEAPWLAGEAASLRGGTWSPLFLPGLDEEIASGEVGIAGGLSFNGNDPSIFLVAEGWIVPTGAANPGAAALWIDAFMQPELLADWGGAKVGVPTLDAALELGQFDDPFFAEASTLMAAQGRFMEQSPYYLESLNALAVAIQELMLDPEQDIEARLREAQNDVLERYWEP